MGFSRYRAEQMGYSPMTAGYVKAQAVGTGSDMIDPMDAAVSLSFKRG